MNLRISAKQSFYKNSGLYIAASIIASVLNYALYPILSRIITPAELGDVGAISTIIVQAGSILLAFNIISIYLVSRESEEMAILKLESIQRSLVKLSVLISVGVILVLPLLKSWLNIGSNGPLIGLALLLITIIPTAIWTGYLQGHNALPLVGIYNAINAAAKVVGAALLSLLGLGASGAVFGMLIGHVSSLAILAAVSPYRLPSLVSITKATSSPGKLPSLRGFIFQAIGVSSLLAILYSLSIISAKLFFDPVEAGVYIGTSTIANSTYFIIMILVWIILPQYSPNKLVHNTSLLRKTLLASSLVVCLTSLAFFLLGKPIIQFALGNDYLSGVPVLWKLSLAQGIVAITALTAYSFLVLRKKGALLLSLMTLISTLIAVMLAEETYNGLVGALIMGGLFGWTIVIIINRVRNLEGMNEND